MKTNPNKLPKKPARKPNSFAKNIFEKLQKNGGRGNPVRDGKAKPLALMPHKKSRMASMELD